MSKTDFQNGFALGLASGGVVEVADTTEIDNLENLIDESGVLDSIEGSVNEKVEQLIGKAETDNLWYYASTQMKSINGLFYQCQTIKKLPKSNFLLATNANSAFQYSTLEEIDFYLDLVSCTSASRMFANTPNLKRIVGINMSKVKNAQELFAESAIEVIEEPLDCSLISSPSYKLNFGSTPNLQEIRFKEGCLFYSVYFNSSKLSAESIQSIIDGLATVTTAQTLTLNSAITLTDEQKATINAKGWTLAQ